MGRGRDKKERTIKGALKAITCQGLNQCEYEKYLDRVTNIEPWKYTIPELMLALEMARLDIPFRDHCPTLLRYELDFFIPINEIAEVGPIGLAVECDIKIWHERKKDKDRQRDFETAQYTNIITIRFNDDDIYKNLQITGQKIAKAYQAIKDMDGLLDLECVTRKLWRGYKREER
jgi:very-short-patch-repair endonuclease